MGRRRNAAHPNLVLFKLLLKDVRRASKFLIIYSLDYETTANTSAG